MIFPTGSTLLAKSLIFRIESRALSQGTFSSFAETSPLTSSPIKIFTPVAPENINAMS